MSVLHRQALSILILTLIFNHLIVCFPRRTKRAFSYSANDTACIVDHVVYKEGDPVPTDDPCETCHCRPPGFKCALQHCEVKTGCKAIFRDGECCPTYKCGCIHNGTHYEEDERIPDADFLCYTCYCHSSSIYCSAPDCEYRFDCEPEYLLGECCPRYDHCATQKHYSLDWKLRQKLNQTLTTISPMTTIQQSNNGSIFESSINNDSLIDITTTTMAPTTSDSNTLTTISSILFSTTNFKYFDNIETTTEYPITTVAEDEPKINVTNEKINLNYAENILETTTTKSIVDSALKIKDQESKFKNLDSNDLSESTTIISINGSIYNNIDDEQFTTIDPIRNDQNETTTTTTAESITSTTNHLHLNISNVDDLTTISSIEITTEVNNE